MPKFLDVTDPVAARLALGALSGINVQKFGADPTSTADSTAAIQAAINEARDAVRDNYDSPGVVVLPGGRYKVSARIVQPPYVKVVTLGNVIIESYVANDSTWHLTPLADDPEYLYGPLVKQEYSAGCPISGAYGGLIITNRGPIASGGNATGLELGARTDLGELKGSLARYRLSDIFITGFKIGIQWNVFYHFIANYDRVNVTGCTHMVRVGNSGQTTVASGENITWNDCLFAQTVASVNTASFTPAFLVESPAIDMNFYSCSFDFMHSIFKFNRGYQRIFISGGNIEGINDRLYRSPTGGIAVSAVPSPDFLPVVQLENVKYIPWNRGVQFKGDLYAEIGLVQGFGTGFIQDPEYANAYLCDTDVVVWNHRVRGLGGMQAVARQSNAVMDSAFASETAGTSGASLTFWESDVKDGTFTHEVDADGPYSGAKSLKFTLTGAMYSFYTCKTYLPCKPADSVVARVAYKFSSDVSAPAVWVSVKWYDSEKVQIGSIVQEPLYRQFTLVNKWAVPDRLQDFKAPAGACFYRVGFGITDPDGDGTSVYRISDVHAYIEG